MRKVAFSSLGSPTLGQRGHARQLGQLVIGCPLADRLRGAVGPELR